MPTRNELIWDAKIILEASEITDESTVDEDYIGFKIDQKRSKEIRDTYSRNPVIEPVWVQDYGIVDFTHINKSEDQAISACDCKFSKAVLPPVVSIHDARGNISDLGVYMISSICGTHEFHNLSLGKLKLLTKDSYYGLYRYWTRIFNSYYLTPDVLKARPFLILEHPLDGYVNDNTNKVSGELVSGSGYEVSSGNITYNGTKYYKGDSFTANSTSTFTGNGKVVLQNQKRRMTGDDQYPMSSTMAEVVLMKLFTQDYGIQSQRIADIRNDSQSQLKILQGNVSQG